MGTLRAARLLRHLVALLSLPACDVAWGEQVFRSDPGCECMSDRECPGGVCQPETDGACGTCFPLVCTDDDDCFGDTCDVARALCEPTDACSALAPESGCEAPALCAPVDEQSRCVAPLPSACEVVPATVVSVDGAAAPAVSVLVTDERGAPLPVSATVTVQPDVVNARADLPGADGDVLCSAPRVVLPPLDAGAARVLVRDARDGAVIEGASVIIDAATGVTGADGALEVASAQPPVLVIVRRDGFETTALVDAGGRDLEVLLTPATADGERAGVAFTADFSGVRSRGDLRIAFATLSMTNVVDGLNTRSLTGENVVTTVDIEGVTDPGGSPAGQPSGTVLHLGTSPVFADAAAIGAPGRRLLSTLASKATLAESGPVFGQLARGEARPYDLMLSLWGAAGARASFGVHGTFSPISAQAPETGPDLARFAVDGAFVTVRPAVDITSEIAVAVPRLAAGHDAAVVALFALVPGRGFTLLGLRFVQDGDEDGDGIVSAPDGDVGLVTSFFAPSLWTAGRPLLALAGSGVFAALREGELPTHRSAAWVEASVVDPDGDGRADQPLPLPAFLPPRTPIVDGAALTLQLRDEEGGAAVPLVLVRGREPGGARYRMLVGGTRTSLTALGPIDEVWTVDIGEESASAFSISSHDGALERALRTRRVF